MGISLKEVAILKSSEESIISLNSTVLGTNERERSTLLDFVATQEDFTESIIEEDYYKYIRKIFDKCKLTSRQREAIYKRYGFDGKGFKTHAKIAEGTDVTRARIRAAEESGIARIALMPECDELIQYMSIGAREEITKKRSRFKKKIAKKI